MRAIICIALLALLGLVSVSAYPHQPYGYVSGWNKGFKASGDNSMRLLFAVKQKNLELLEEVLYSVSTPSSPLYGQHLTIDQLTQMTAIPEASQSIAEFLKKHGAESIEVTPDYAFVRANLPVAVVEKEFKTTIHHYSSKTDSRRILRAETYSIPHCLQHHIDWIGYINHFPNPKIEKFVTYSEKKVGDSSGNCVPSTINGVYGIDSNTVATPKSTQGCFEDGQNVSPLDIATFQKNYGLPNQPISRIVGPNNAWACLDPNQCVEAELDTEYIMAVAQGAPTTFWAMNPQDQTPFIDWLIALSNDPTAPIVNSVSYGEVEQQVPTNVTATFNTQIQKLGARGITVIVSSGDDGVANFPARDNAAQCGFYPSYPASSPFVTAVGATQGPEANPSTAEVGESSATGGLITSGGGFSTVWAQPTYQRSAVQSYLSQSSIQPPFSQFNSSGRGYPDVAILGHNYVIVAGGQSVVVSGTSASAPVFAGMITLINAERIQAGKPVLGFLNPALYDLAQSNPSVFNDITQGQNNCCAAQSNPICCQYGFHASQGWDAMTGLGSVNFKALKQALVAL